MRTQLHEISSRSPHARRDHLLAAPALEPQAIDAALADETMQLCVDRPQPRSGVAVAGQTWWIEGRHLAEPPGEVLGQEAALVRTLSAQLARLDAERRDICRILDGANRRRLDGFEATASQ